MRLLLLLSSSSCVVQPLQHLFPQKKQQQKNTQSAQDLNWIEPKHECKHLIKVTVQNILVFITNLVDLRDESSLADCSYVNSCLEVLRDLVAVEQDIDISLKLLTTNAICWWAKQHHPLQKTTTKIKLKNLNWISLKTFNDSNSIMAQVLLGNETQSKNFLHEQEKKKKFFFLRIFKDGATFFYSQHLNQWHICQIIKIQSALSRKGNSHMLTQVV